MPAFEWRGAFTNDELNAPHTDAFGHRPSDDDWRGNLERHSRGWVTARGDTGLVGFVNVVWDAREIDRDDYDQPSRWTLLTCRQGHVLLVVQYAYSPRDFDDDTVYRLWPPQDRTLSWHIPQELRTTHEEARACFRAKAYTATVVMCGRTIEGACAKQGVEAGTLQKSLDKMKDWGIIDGWLAEWADTLRAVRNSAAHFSDEAVSRQARSPIARRCWTTCTCSRRASRR